jgi:hypothetical protein
LEILCSGTGLGQKFVFGIAFGFSFGFKHSFRFGRNFGSIINQNPKIMKKLKVSLFSLS